MNSTHSPIEACLLASAILLLSLPAASEENDDGVRPWTRKDGKVAVGKLIAVEEEQAVISLSERQQFQVPVSELSIDDQQYIKTWTPPLPVRPLHVPKEARFADGNWYLVVHGKISWEEAKKQARRKKGVLARITTQAQLEAVTSMNGEKSYLWLGASDKKKEGEWRWLNGDPVTNPFWDRNEPSNGSGEDYVSMRPGGKWNDLTENSRWGTGYVVMWEGE
ncbi:MAG: hypothetical protein MI807_03260 [Verrucomicrobiales bacterium]|nr:hypothetical protein [Verrucomicrobiales bacterium]